MQKCEKRERENEKDFSFVEGVMCMCGEERVSVE